MIAPRLILKLSVMRLAADATARSSPGVALTAFLPRDCIGGKMKIIPAIAIKLNWKETVHSIWALIPTIMAAAKARAVIALRCLPSSSAARTHTTVKKALPSNT